MTSTLQEQLQTEDDKSHDTIEPVQTNTSTNGDQLRQQEAVPPPNPVTPAKGHRRWCCLSSSENKNDSPKPTRRRRRHWVSENDASSSSLRSCTDQHDERRMQAKQRAQQYKANKKQQQDDERLLNKCMAGLAYGFDPRAGTRFYDRKQDHSEDKRNQAPSPTQAQSSVPRELTSNGDHMKSNTSFGLEFGGPGREANFMHGYKQRRGQDGP